MHLKKIGHKIITSLFVLIPILNLYAQRENIRFSHLSIEEGLSQNSALSIVQDDIGFMWFGTKGGINKYDGYNFTVYKADIFDSNSVSQNQIESICKDHSGIFWFGTENGLNRLDHVRNTFTRYLHDPHEPNSISHNRIKSICEDANKELWIGTSNGLNRLNKERNQFVRYFKDSSNQNSISGNDVRVVYRDKSGAIWIGTYGDGLNQFDRKKGQFIHYTHDIEAPNSLSDNFVLAIYEDKNGILWIGTEKGGLNRFDKKREQFKSYKTIPDNPNSLNDNHITVIYEDLSGRLWIGTNSGGVSIFDREKEKFFSCQNNPDNLSSLSGNQISSIFEDNTGNIWIGTTGYGINIYNQEAEKFIHYHHEHQNSNSLNDNMTWGIYEDKSGILWIGTNAGGLNKFDREKNIFTHYVHDNKNPHSLSSNLLDVIYEDRSGVLWVGTNDGLNKFIRETELFTHYKFDPDDPYSISNNKIRSVYEDRFGTLWIGTRGGGLNKFDRKTERFKHFKHNPDDSTSISSNLVYCLYEDRSNNFWVGTNGGGLNKFDLETEQFFHYMMDPENKNSLSDNYVTAIHEDSFGNLWIGTYGGGLNKFDREKEIFTYYTEKDGLSNNEVYTILEDNKGNLWLSTNRGLSKFDPETETFKIYYVEDGLQSNEFNIFSACKSESGEMFFGGINGFNAFFPDSIIDNPFPPSIVITDFKLSNKPVLPGKMPDGRTILEKSITETEEITLSHRDKVISFEFAALHYVSPEKNQYAYIMEGLEKEWNHVGNRRFVTYSGLSPGKYIFKVKGSNNDGVWNEEGKSIKITIIPPFWRTWWFYTLCVIFIILLIVAIILYQVNRLEEKKKEEERLRVITDVGQVLEHGRATIYRRKINSDVYDYIGNGIKDITGYSTEEYTLTVWKKIVQKVELIGEYSGLTFEEALERIQEGRIDNFVMDFSVRTKSGEIRWARDITTVLRDESGSCYAYLGIIFDITDRKFAEQELAEKGKSIQRTLFEHTPDPIFIFDKETHKFLDCNRAAVRVYGYSRDEIRAMTPFDLHSREDKRAVTKNIDVRNIDVPHEYVHITKDGMQINVEIVSDETVYKGTPAWISIARNITERKEAEQELRLRKEEMENDLNMAREVQMALLSHNYPKTFPGNVPGEQSALQFSHRYIPTSELAGDFFEILPISDHEIGILIYDVMGHGVQASLLTAYLHGLVGELMPIASDTVTFVHKLNAGLRAIMQQFSSGMFATAFYLVADVNTGRVCYTNAGHPAPYILRRGKGTVEILKQNMKQWEPALGLTTSFKYTASEYSMNNDDVIFFFTDGLYEVMDADGRLFGNKRLRNIIKSKLNKPPDQLMDEIIGEVNKYSGSKEFRDDVCMISMHVKSASV